MSIIKPNILKSKNDKRKGYTYELPNKLRILIFQDEDVDVACVSMLVKIGYFQDEISGMAHFLEHMLFNGTKKFPDENLFSSFISENNGYSNAWTAHNHTCYYYTLSQNGLNKSLELFANFFICPLLNKDCVDREKEAVNSEHKKNVNNDNWRRQEILRVATTKNHWFSKFGTGSNVTLDIKDIHIRVREFFDKYYSADLMTLVVVSKDSIENIKKIIDKNFLDIKLKKINKNHLTQEIKILNTPTIIKYVPIENDKKIILVWEVDFYRKEIEKSPLDFFSKLANNQQKNSIYDILISKEYATNFQCYVREIIYDKCLFCADISLTLLGEQNKSFIFSLFNNFIDNLLKNIDSLEELYDENLKLIKYNFDFFEKKNCIDFINEINGILTNYEINPEKILLVDTLQDSYESIKNNLKKLLQTLKISNAVIVICSDKYSKYKLLEFPYYGTKYFIDSKQYSLKKNVDIPQIPKLNPYISVLEKIYNYSQKNPNLIETKNSKIYFQQNTEFQTPDIFLFICINNVISTYNVKIYVCMILYLTALIKQINNEIYLLAVALYNISIDYSDGNIYIKMSGNYEKFDVILNLLLNRLLNYDIISEKIFAITKFEITKMCENNLYTNPYEKLPSLFKKQINKTYYNSEDILSAISDISLDNIKKIFREILPINNIISYIYGNCTEKQFEKIKNTMNKIPHKLYIGNNKNIKNITSKEILQITNKNNIEENNANGYYIFIDEYNYKYIKYWIKNYCCLNILHNLISTKYFDQLRTKEMFGYIATSRIIQIGNKTSPSFYYLFMVQSPSKSNKETTERTEKFIKDFVSELDKTTEDKINTIKESFITSLMSKFNNANEYTNHIFYNELETEYLQYNYREIIAKNANQITKQDLIIFYKTKILNNDKKIVLQLNK